MNSKTKIKFKNYTLFLYKVIRIAVLPPILLYIFNLGIIHNWSNKFQSIDYIIDYLSRDSYTNPTLSYIIGLATVFALFFSFAPLIYSRKYIPAFVYPKFIFVHNKTLTYFGLILGIAFAYYILSTCKIITNHNLIIIVGYFIFAIIMSIIYFRWITKIIIPKNIFKEILSSFDLKRIEEIEKEKLSSNRIEFDKIIKTENYIDIFGNIDNPFSELLTHNYVTIKTGKKGLVTNINIKGIYNLIKKHLENIAWVDFNVLIGDSVPNPSFEIEFASQTLMTIYLKKVDSKTNFDFDIFKDSEEDDQSLEPVISYFQKKSSELQTQFTIDSKLPTFWDYIELIDDSVNVYANGISKDFGISPSFFSTIEKYIEEEYESDHNYSWHGKHNIKEEIFNYLINKIVKESINNSPKYELDKILKLFYILNRVAVKYESKTLITNILENLRLLFFKIITNQKYQVEKHQILLLYIQELTFSYEMSKIFEEKNTEEMIKYWDDFINEIVFYGIRTSTLIYYNIIDYSYLYDQKVFTKNLVANGQRLIDFLDSLFHFEDSFLEKNNYETNDNRIRDKVKIAINTLAKNIIYLSIIIYRDISKGVFNKDFIKIICLPLVENCNNIGKNFSITSEDLLKEMFFSYEYSHPVYSILSHNFEENPIHEASSYSPRYYNFNSFWFEMSILLKSNGKNFIPFKLPDKISHSTYIKLFNYIKYLRNNSITVITDKFDNIDKIRVEYIGHLEALINSVPINIRKEIESTLK